ncbi:MAG: molybdopterin dehydrogenase [Planctomycetaceae bacterium]|jgi:xanthine dehydrogenase YagS FAD-binding subunit|nr:molybdopterin dehydrogenase [Planctomycetaceae bacterium]MDP7276205.1 FAD binding domain-containing protein [Planctomycetaceae bacterium]
MRPFEYARPQSEGEALDLLNDHDANTAILAGGTDLISLLQEDLQVPQRVVDIKNVDSMQAITADGTGVIVGALTTLEDIAEHPMLADYRSLLDVVDGTRSIQVQSMGTLGGDLCHLPNCWYFRNGYGLLGLEDGESLVASGDNRYHAVLGNQGPAKFVSASRFAPALIAWGAEVRVIGPEPTADEWLPLEQFFVTPKVQSQGISVLEPGQMISHVRLPDAQALVSSTYEVLQLEGLDWPLASAAATLDLDGGVVREARIVMGHVAPTPWTAHEAGQSLVGLPVDEETAGRAGEIAVAEATPLSGNAYKVQLARTAVKRALLGAVDKLEGAL